MVLHGHLRATMDLDLVVQLTSENASRTVSALEVEGFRPVAPVPALNFADPDVRARWMREKNMLVFSMWVEQDPTFKVDLFVEEPFDFEAAWARAVVVNLGGIEVRVAALSDLIAMKLNAGRPQDLADVTALRELAR